MSTHMHSYPSEPALTALGPHDHPCLIYENADEQADAFVPYLHAGLLAGEKCVYVVDETHPEFIVAAFKARGVDVHPFISSGAFSIISKHEAYLTQGYFDTAKMVQFWEDTVKDALARGFTAVRAAAEMTWALGNEPGVDQLIRYESQLNNLFPRLPVSALCQYQRRRFPAATIKEMIHVHPVVVSGNQTLVNPGFIPHDEFIESHDDMEVQALLDHLALANKLQQQNKELRNALESIEKSQAEIGAYKRLKERLEQALASERETRLYAESIKNELEEFVNNATEGLHWVGPDGTILWANRAELELLGYSEAEYVGRNIREFHADTHAIEDIIRRLQSNETLHNYETRLRCKDGSTKTVLISSNVLWREGKFVHTQCFTRDITDLKLAQQEIAQTEEIRALNQELHTLARVVSHELQEPIAKIRSYLSLLSVRYKDRLGEDADEFITTCSQSAKIINRMIDDLWLYARMIRIDESDIAEVATGSIVSSVLFDYKEAIAAADAKISVGDLPHVRYSEKHFSHLFDSLLNNALSYRQANVPLNVNIQASPDNGEFVFSVKDNGTGIDSMYTRDIFKAFYRIGERPSEKGTGMGLAICQKIVQSHGGRMWCESKPGEGSTFYFTVPAG